MSQDSKIYNPLSKRYIAIDGATGKKVIEKYKKGEIELRNENVAKLKALGKLQAQSPTPKMNSLKLDNFAKKMELKRTVLGRLKKLKLKDGKITNVKLIDKDTFVVHLEEFSNMSQINTQGTSKIYNGHFKNEKYFIKDVVKSIGTNSRTNMYGVYDIELAMNELLASKIYTDIYGIDAIHLFLVVNNSNEKYPKYMIASKAIEIDTCEPITQDCKDLLDNKIPGAIEPFLVDCILANWDVGSRGNVGIIGNRRKKAFRIDVGGSLMFRAMGQRREFKNIPNEHDNFFIQTNKGYKLFKSLTEKQIDKMFTILEIVDKSVFDNIKNQIEQNINFIDKQDLVLANKILKCMDIVKARHNFYIKNKNKIQKFLNDKVQV